MASIRIRVGRPRDIGHVMDRVEAATIRGIAEEIVERVQERIDHPAADTLRVRGINQHAVDIIGSRGGPGIINPTTRKALLFDNNGGAQFAARVHGVGFEPLMKAEAFRLNVLNINRVIA